MTVLLLKIACIMLAGVGIFPVSQSLSLIVTGPESVNTSIGSQVQFQCLFQNVPSCPFHIQWILNGIDVGALHGQMSTPPDVTQNYCNENEISIGTMILYLYKSQDIALDNSEIVCIGRVVNYPYYIVTSSSALLRIQGILGQPPGLTTELSTDSNSLIINWNLPYTLNGVDILEISINISSYSISDPSNLSPVETGIISGAMTSYVYSVSASCAVYNVSVQAETLAGLGEPSYVDQTVFGRAPKRLTPEDIAINVAYIQQSICVTFTFNDSSCEAEQADMAGVVIYNGSDVIYSKEEVELVNLSYAERKFAVTLPSTLKHLLANTTIKLTNTAENKFTESTQIILNLFYVQDLNLRPIPSGIELKCIFAENSYKQSCKVVIWCDDCRSEEHGYEVQLSPETRISNFSACDLACISGKYCFAAFDVYDSMETSTSIPAVTKSNITVTETSSCSTMTSAAPIEAENTSNDARIIRGVIPLIALFVINPLIFICILI